MLRGTAVPTDAPAIADGSASSGAAAVAPVVSPSGGRATGAGMPAPSLPRIDGAVKRVSATTLQRVMSRLGYYTAPIDGLYGPGTRRAYELAAAGHPVLSLIPPAAPSGNAATAASMADWPEVLALRFVAGLMAAGRVETDRAATFDAQRRQLLETKQALSNVATSRTQNWEGVIWKNLEMWGAEDPLHQQIVDALAISYYQTKVRMEQHYSNQKFTGPEAGQLATAMMQNLVGAQLERFL